MTPATYNITIVKGATFSRRFILKDSTNTPINLSGHQIKAEIWSHLRKVKLATFTVIWNSRSQGDFTLVLTPEQTRSILYTGYWDILVINPDQSKDYWIRGIASCVEGFTSE